MRPLNWYGNLSYGQGYSGSSLEMVRYLNRIRDVSIVGFVDKDTPEIKDRALHPEVQEILSKPFKMAKIGISYGLPNSFSSIFNKVKIGFTMFETDKLPSGKSAWAGKTGNPIDAVNQMDALFVPCEHNRELFLHSGTKVPIFVVPLGVDTDKKPILVRPDRSQSGRKFRFLFVSTLNQRKGVDLLFQAFRRMFKGRDDVELVMKVNKQSLQWQVEGVNLTMIDDYLSPEAMDELYQSADAFVFPSRGEGFGLTPLEAMYRGLPTIVSDNTGMSDYIRFDEQHCIAIPMKGMSKAVGFPKDWGEVGNWYEPDFDALCMALWDVFENRNDYNEMSVKASTFVAQNYSYKNTAQRIDEILQEHFE